MMSQKYDNELMMSQPYDNDDNDDNDNDDNDDNKLMMSQPYDNKLMMSQPLLLTQSMNVNDDENEKDFDFNKVVNTNQINFVPENNELIFDTNYLSLNNIGNSEQVGLMNFHLDHENVNVNVKPYFDNNAKLMNIGDNNVDFLVNKNVKVRKNKKILQGYDDVNLENNIESNYDLINGVKNLYTNTCSTSHQTNFNSSNIPKINQDVTGFSNDFEMNENI
jgi:hypothetical protein